MLHWLDHVKSKREETMTKKEYIPEVEGCTSQERIQLTFYEQIGCVFILNRGRESPKSTWQYERIMKGMEVRELYKHRDIWRLILSA